MLFTYSHELATITADIDALNLAKASASVSTIQNNVSFGLSAEANLAKSALGPVTVGLGYKVPNLFDLYLKSNKTDHSASLTYAPSKDVTLVGQALYGSSAWNFVLAGVYNCNANTALKLKLSTKAGLSASVKQSFDKKLNVVVAAEVPKTHDSVKVGVAVTLG